MVFKVNFDDSGFRELQGRLNQLRSNEKVRIDELLDNRFMMHHTGFRDIDEMIKAAGIVVKSVDDARKLNRNEKWNRFISETTRFVDWDDMLKAAGMEYVKRVLGLD